MKAKKVKRNVLTIENENYQNIYKNDLRDQVIVMKKLLCF